ncbi:MAG TPA: phosphate signaling complex protein PhoU [Gammaproteobacteria bacterium]|nr:phosphate signaling complex protein PhoU [Gammaproteobacteria bacterium]
MDTDRKNLTHHISKRFNRELEDLRNRVLRMGGMVETQLTDALNAVGNGDEQLGREVIEHDYQLNAMEVEIDEECVLILARRQPAASDLRLVFAMMKTITDLERIGDEAKKIARLALSLAETKWAERRYTEIGTLGWYTSGMVHQVLDALARLDPELAVEICKKEQIVDREYEVIMRQIITYMMEDPRTISRSLEAAWAARALERIGDHARNIAENLIFLIKGKDIRHTELNSVSNSAQPQQ